MRNSLTDLNGYLFEQLDKLTNDDLNGEELEKEISRSEAISAVADKIIKNGELAFKTMKHLDEYGYERKKHVPEMLECGE